MQVGVLGVAAMNREGAITASAADRFAHALSRAQIPADAIALNAFSCAWPQLDRWARDALPAYGLQVIDPETLARTGKYPPTIFVGPPDRLHALCKSGYARVFTHALVAGGAVFPVIRTRAALSKVALSEMLHAPAFGPFALRAGDDPLFHLLEGVEASIVRPGTLDPLHDGMIGEIAVRATGDRDETWAASGILSAFEMVPHRHREPGLVGWLGDADAQATFGSDHSAGAREMAAIVAFHEAVLDARLMIEDTNGQRRPVLQVETEAGDWIEGDIAQRFKAMTGAEPVVERVLPGRLPPTGRAVGYRAAS